MRSSILFLVVVVTILAGFMRANTQDKDLQKNEKKSNVKPDEIVLDEILIEGRVEKPNVMIMPNRVSTQFQESEFPQRSFVTEIIKLPPAKVLFDKDFGSIERIDDLKAAIRKIINRNDN